MILKFNDGVELDISGPLRTEQRADGWYVLGEGMSVPVKSKEEGDGFIDQLYVTP